MYLNRGKSFCGCPRNSPELRGRSTRTLARSKWNLSESQALWGLPAIPLAWRSGVSAFASQLPCTSGRESPGLVSETEEDSRQKRPPGSKGDCENSSSTRTRARPFFTLLNLVDAHEPFFPSRWRPNGRSTSELLRVRQDFSSIVDGKWIPTEDDYSILRELYRGAVNAAISRVVGIIAILREQRRWDETVFVLTADHGQALGQEGVPLHGGPPIDALVRIPLIVRLPGAVARSPPTCTEWASLADVVPTVLKAVGIQSPNGLDGEPLQTVASTGPTPRKVFSYGEGMFGWKPDLVVPPQVRARMDFEAIAVYSGSRKVMLDSRSGVSRAYGVHAGGAELIGTEDYPTPVDEELGAAARATRAAIDVAKHDRAPSLDRSKHLLRWGYVRSWLTTALRC